jgi:hypothetical protein
VGKGVVFWWGVFFFEKGFVALPAILLVFSGTLPFFFDVEEGFSWIGRKEGGRVL